MGGEKKNGKGGRMFEARGGGGILERVTRAGSPVTSRVAKDITLFASTIPPCAENINHKGVRDVTNIFQTY